MVREILRRDQPRNGRQGALIYVVAQLMENVTSRDIDGAGFLAFGIFNGREVAEKWIAGIDGECLFVNLLFPGGK
jgi:hypothetical protein